MKGWLKRGVGAFLLPFAAMASQQAAADIYDAVVMERPIVQLAENWQLIPSFSVGTGIQT